MTNKTCKTCRHWEMLSIDLKEGDCHAPQDHRYWRIRTPGMAPGTYALMDGFGRETTKPSFSCDAYVGGDE